MRKKDSLKVFLLNSSVDGWGTMNILVDGKRYEIRECKTIEDALKMCQYPSEECGNCPKAGRLLELLSYFKSMPLEIVPPMSIIREFAGGSSINYGK